MAVALQGNNPGGIINSPWAQRQPGYVGANGMYARFRTMADGVAAQIRLLRNYISRGRNTPNLIAQSWAPAGVHGNNPTLYARNIASQLGIGINDRITESNLLAFQNAQATAENHNYTPNDRAWAKQNVPNWDSLTPGQQEDVLRRGNDFRNSIGNADVFGIGTFLANLAYIFTSEFWTRFAGIIIGIIIIGIALYAFVAFQKGEININTKDLMNVGT